MTEKITRQEAERRIQQQLSNYVNLDNQLSLLNKQSSEIRRQRNKIEEQVDLLARALKLSGSQVKCSKHTFEIDYVQPKVSLSQKLLKETLLEFFKIKTNISSPEDITQQFLEFLEYRKQNLSSQREKSLKLKYS